MQILKSFSIIFLKIFNIILDFIFPPCCLICGKEGKEYICRECEKSLNLEYKYKIKSYENKYFIKHVYFFKYENKIRNLIIDYKFRDRPYLYKIFTKFLLKNKKICRFLKSYDIITSVPMHKVKKRLRGYNQSTLIARDISKTINLRYEELLVKNKKNKVQSKLKKSDRIENVKNVYSVINKEKIINKNIIIFDDIYTTGSTLNECARVLKNNGAKNIIVFTIAKD